MYKNGVLPSSFFSNPTAPSATPPLAVEDASEKLLDRLSRLLAADRVGGLEGTADRAPAAVGVGGEILISWGL